jgi:uncharacterized protein (TIGR02757 family)
MITREELDKLVKKYETKEFIKDDPIQFPHRGKTKAEIELYGFIASLFSYGSRKVFIKKLDEIFKKAEGDLVGFIKNGDFSSLKGVDYRFSKENDIIPIFATLSKIYNESRGLEELFEAGFTTSCEQKSYQEFLYSVVNYFYSNAPKTVGQGFYHMIPNPRNGGAMKRMNMFLRWMVRSSQVDLGVWSCLQPKDLLIPLDVHVARVSREMGLLRRKSNDFNAPWELMEHLRSFCPDDPVKYDFAMFAFGIELNKNK